MPKNNMFSLFEGGSYKKYPTRNLVVYDYGSIMHYGKYYFPKYRYIPAMEVTAEYTVEIVEGDNVA